MTRLNKQREKLAELLNGVNPLNAKSHTAEITKLLDKYIPNVERMHTQLKKYKGTFTETIAENDQLKAQNAELEASLKDATTESVLKKLKTAQLQRDYEQAARLLSQIPPEILAYYGGKPAQERQVHEHD